MSIINHYIKLHSIMKYGNRFYIKNDLFDLIDLVEKNYIKSEVIGSWLYCFTNPLIGVQLLLLGFWFSLKHKAFIYSGSEKEGFADNETLDEIRRRLGNKKIQS